MLVGIMGDLHQAYWMLQNFRPGDVDLAIQVGDFGFIHRVYPYEKPAVPVWFIDGNHDSIVWLKERSNNYQRKVVINKNLTYVPRGWVEQIGSKVFGFMGGADTPSWARAPFKKSGLWYPEEQISHEDVNRLRHNLNGRKLDILICHEPPVEVKYAARLGVTEGESAFRLQEIVKEFKPEKVFCGHMHASFTYVIGNSTVVKQLDEFEICTLEV